MEDIDIKKVLIFALIVLLLIIGIILGINLIKDNGKTYELVEIKEEEYKYFTVFTDDKYGVLNEEGKMIIDNIYSSIIIPNPTKAVFICKKENRRNRSIK